MPDAIVNSGGAGRNPDYYRPCVGAVLFDMRGLVWVGKRVAEPDFELEFAWQMPQGGIDVGEPPEKAVMRELLEETGCGTADIIREAGSWFTYDLPDHLLKRPGKANFRGQRQKWFALLFKGSDRDFRLDLHDKPEFSEWKWVDLHRVPELIVPFKRDVYKKVVEEFRDLPERIANA